MVGLMDAHERFIDMLRRLDIPQPPCFSAVGPGWMPAIEAALVKMIAAGWDRDLHQAKEKYGGLRLYIGDASAEVHKIVDEVETACNTICEECAAAYQPGPKQQTRGWVYSVCDTCLEKR